MGGRDYERFSIKDGQRTLLNDSTVATSLKCYYGLKPSAIPAVSITTAGGNATVTGQGTLQQAPLITGPWSDIYGPLPVVTPANAPQSYFRARQ